MTGTLMTIVALALALALASPAAAADAFEVEYITGHAAVKSFTGTLTIAPDAVVVTRKGAAAITVLLATITDVKASMEPYTPGATTFRWGKGKNTEFVTITTTGTLDTGAEAIVLKTKPHEAPGIVAKIDFARKRVAIP